VAPGHLPTKDVIDAWPRCTPDRPLKVLVSGCLVGAACGTDGSSYGAPYSTTERLLQLPAVQAIPFCPEDFAFGTPREVPDIHGGDGFDVLDGHARVLSSAGLDWTDAMVGAAEAMLAVALDHEARLALLLDISAACGSQVIYLGPRSQGIYQAGVGAAPRC
jgi:uncharacterized protein YbbK (DUF523 family)